MNIQDMYSEVLEAEERVERARAESRAYAMALAMRLSDFTEPLESSEDTLPTPAAGGAPRLDPGRAASAGVRSPTEQDAPIVDALDKPQPPSPDSLLALARVAADRFTSAADASNQFDGYRQRELDGLGLRSKYWVEIHKKGSIPAACIVFVLIGAPIAVRYPQAGVALVVGVSLAFFGAYYVSLVGGEELADRLWVSPLWAMWLPNVLFGTIGIGLMIQARRVTR
jgi:lipopolysaccharide export LptBFGC system permease protein LptF